MAIEEVFLKNFNSILPVTGLESFLQRFRGILNYEYCIVWGFEEEGGSYNLVASDSESCYPVPEVVIKELEQLCRADLKCKSYPEGKIKGFQYADDLARKYHIFHCIFQGELYGLAMVRISQKTLNVTDGLWEFFCDHIACLIAIRKKNRKMDAAMSRLISLQYVLRQVSSTLDVSKVLKEIVHLAARTVNAKLAWVSLIRPHTTELKPDAYYGIEGDYFTYIKVTVDETITGQGPSGRCIRSKKPQIVRDTQSDPHFLPWRYETAKKGYRSIVAAPLIFQDICLGMIAVYSMKVNAFNQEDIDVLQSFAYNAAIAIEHARLFEQRETHLLELQKLNETIQSRNALLQNALASQLELSHILLRGQGISAITQKIAQLAGNPTIVEDRFFDVLCHAGFKKEADLEIHLKGSRSLFVLFPKEANILLSKTQPVLFPPAPGHGYHKPRLMAPILDDNNVLGYISMIEEGHSMDESLFMLIDKSALVLALSFSKEKAAHEVEQRLIGEWFRDLIEKKKNDDELLNRSIYLNFDLSQKSHLVILEFSCMASPGKNHQNTRRLDINNKVVHITKKVLSQFIYPSLVLIDKDYLVILMPSDLLRKNANSAGGSEKFVSKIVMNIVNIIKEHFAEVTFLALLGGEHTTVSELRRNYIDTSDALSIARRLKEQDKLISKDNLRTYIILYRNGDEWLRAYINQNMGPLIEYDRLHKCSLVLTLDTYLICNCNLIRTSEKLFIHPNTMKYRVKRIKDILGIDYDDPNVLLNIKLALMSMKIL